MRRSKRRRPCASGEGPRTPVPGLTEEPGKGFLKERRVCDRSVGLGRCLDASMAELKRLISWREASAQDAELEKPTNIPSTGRASTSLRCPVPVRGSEVQPSQGEGPRREGRYPRRRGVGCSRTTFSRLGAHLGRSPTRVWRVQIGGR